jgi:hypothetical protein
MRTALRFLFGAMFVLGLLCFAAIGALVAAYHDWGGVPPHLWMKAKTVAMGGAGGVALGGLGWFFAVPMGQRLRDAGWALGTILLAGIASGAALFLHYSLRLDTSHKICAPALITSTRASRDAALQQGLGPLFPVIDPHPSCVQLERERRALDRNGECPEFVMDDTACTCGSERWEASSKARCTPGPTSCEYRDDKKARAIGCPRPNNPELKDALDMQ